jgi:hypothetical protein
LRHQAVARLHPWLDSRLVLQEDVPDPRAADTISPTVGEAVGVGA